MIVSGAGPAVVACTRSSSKRGSSSASTAVTMIGMYSGLQPAMTALTAIFSIVAMPSPGGMTPMTSRGSRRM